MTVRPAARWLLPTLTLAICLVGSGCVQRRMTIRSNPPGATVYVDDYEIGTTPISHNFLYYGTREIRLVKDGYETLTVMQPFKTPWYQIPPLDFVSDNLVPGEIRDHRDLSYNLAPQAVVPPEHLLGRAEQLRRGMHTATGLTPPAVRIGPPQPMLGGPEMIPTPTPAFGGQPVYPVSP